jgi:hypothetical protein
MRGRKRAHGYILLRFQRRDLNASELRNDLGRTRKENIFQLGHHRSSKSSAWITRVHGTSNILISINTAIRRLAIRWDNGAYRVLNITSRDLAATADYYGACKEGKMVASPKQTRKKSRSARLKNTFRWTCYRRSFRAWEVTIKWQAAETTIKLRDVRTHQIEGYQERTWGAVPSKQLQL